MSENNSISTANLIANFPFEKIRPKQLDVLQQIGQAINAGYKYIVLEAPTGFGKSPVAVAVARALGTSYICSATKELQTQYTNDFPYMRSVKGMNNFDCLVREDFMLNKTYECGLCKISLKDDFSNNLNECKHRRATHGPCRDGQPSYVHVRKHCKVCNDRSSGFHDGCRYRTFLEDYDILNANSDKEEIFINGAQISAYQVHSTLREGANSWSHLVNVTRPEVVEKRSQFLPCPYYDQLNKGLLASHSIFNYANFLIFVSIENQIRRRKIKPRNLLVLDEGHQIENQIVEYIGISISKRTLQKYMDTNLFEHTNYKYDEDIETTWLKLLDNLYVELSRKIPNIRSSEIMIDANEYLEKLRNTIDVISEDPKNWIVSEILYDDNKSPAEVGNTEVRKVTKVTFKPLDIAPYCKKLFELCDITLIMSATILDVDTFWRNVGLDRNLVKFIEVSSDFPPENRPVYRLNTAYLNYNSLKLESVQHSLAEAIDKIMDLHVNDKGIIHTTSYAQVRFIERLLSKKNRVRLISTDPQIPRDEIIARHWMESNGRSVLISPSLHTGLDLKDDQSRFQILVKIPYPSRSDKWIEKKRLMNGGKWYGWQTALKLVQACGRSIRSKEDWAKTYVLDSAFDRFIRENKLPVWFLEGII